MIIHSGNSVVRCPAVLSCLDKAIRDCENTKAQISRSPKRYVVLTFCCNLLLDQFCASKEVFELGVLRNNWNIIINNEIFQMLQNVSATANRPQTKDTGTQVRTKP